MITLVELLKLHHVTDQEIEDIESLIDKVEDDDDVQSVFTNIA